MVGSHRCQESTRPWCCDEALGQRAALLIYWRNERFIEKVMELEVKGGGVDNGGTMWGQKQHGLSIVFGSQQKDVVRVHHWTCVMQRETTPETLLTRWGTLEGRGEGRQQSGQKWASTGGRGVTYGSCQKMMVNP